MCHTTSPGTGDPLPTPHGKAVARVGFQSPGVCCVPCPPHAKPGCRQTPPWSPSLCTRGWGGGSQPTPGGVLGTWGTVEDAGELRGQTIPWVGVPWPRFAPAPSQLCAPLTLKQPQKVSPLWLPTVASPGLGTRRTVPLRTSILAPRHLGTPSWASWGPWWCRVGLAVLAGGAVVPRQCAIAVLLSNGHEEDTSLGHPKQVMRGISLPTGVGSGRGGCKPTAPVSLEQQHCESPSKADPAALPLLHTRTQGNCVYIPCSVPQFPHSALHLCFPGRAQSSGHR